MTTRRVTTTFDPVGAVPRSVVGALAVIETKGYLRRVSIWIGLGLTPVAMLTHTSSDWSGGAYENTIPLGCMWLAIGTFVAGLRTGGRDSSSQLPDFFEDAPVDPGARTVARLMGLVGPMLLAVVVVAVVAIVSRVEGGFWIGDRPRRTGTALHTPSELLQPLLLVALFGAIGVALGRAVRAPRVAIALVGGVVGFIVFGFWWVMNAPVLRAMALVQIQPLRIDLPPDIDPDRAPAKWLLDAPADFHGVWTHRVVHVPTVAGHDLYLLGLVMLVCGWAVRGARGRRVAIVGFAVTILGVMVQLAVRPE